MNNLDNWVKKTKKKSVCYIYSDENYRYGGSTICKKIVVFCVMYASTKLNVILYNR